MMLNLGEKGVIGKVVQGKVVQMGSMLGFLVWVAEAAHTDLMEEEGGNRIVPTCMMPTIWWSA